MFFLLCRLPAFLLLSTLPLRPLSFPPLAYTSVTRSPPSSVYVLLSLSFCFPSSPLIIILSLHVDTDWLGRNLPSLPSAVQLAVLCLMHRWPTHTGGLKAIRHLCIYRHFSILYINSAWLAIESSRWKKNVFTELKTRCRTTDIIVVQVCHVYDH